jgi:hypothetical protein
MVSVLPASTQPIGTPCAMISARVELRFSTSRLESAGPGIEVE